jgi:hypothetical protein
LSRSAAESTLVCAPIHAGRTDVAGSARGAPDDCAAAARLSRSSAGSAGTRHAVPALTAHTGPSAGAAGTTATTARLPHAAADLAAQAAFQGHAAGACRGAYSAATSTSATTTARLTYRAASNAHHVARARSTGAASPGAASLRRSSTVVAHGRCLAAPLQTAVTCSADVAGTALLARATAGDAVVRLIAAQAGAAAIARTALLTGRSAIRRHTGIDDRIASVGRRARASAGTGVAALSSSCASHRSTAGIALHCAAVASGVRGDTTSTGRVVVAPGVLARLTLRASCPRRDLRRVLGVSPTACETRRNSQQGEHSAEPETLSLFFHRSVHLSKKKVVTAPRTKEWTGAYRASGPLVPGAITLTQEKTTRAQSHKCRWMEVTPTAPSAHGGTTKAWARADARRPQGHSSLRPLRANPRICAVACPLLMGRA